MSENMLIAIGIGVAAGIIDITPMIMQKMDRYSNLSAFTHWLVLGMIIPFVSWGVEPWLKGLIIGELSAVPILFVVAPKDRKAIIPIIVMSALLGIGIALAGRFFMV